MRWRLFNNRLGIIFHFLQLIPNLVLKFKKKKTHIVTKKHKQNKNKNKNININKTKAKRSGKPKLLGLFGVRSPYRKKHNQARIFWKNKELYHDNCEYIEEIYILDLTEIYLRHVNLRQEPNYLNQHVMSQVQ